MYSGEREDEDEEPTYDTDFYNDAMNNAMTGYEDYPYQQSRTTISNIPILTPEIMQTILDSINDSIINNRDPRENIIEINNRELVFNGKRYSITEKQYNKINNYITRSNYPIDGGRKYKKTKKSKKHRKSRKSKKSKKHRKYRTKRHK